MSEYLMSNHHPECKDGEIFIGNIAPTMYKGDVYGDVRRGNDAYDIYGGRVGSMIPVFAKIDQYLKDGWVWNDAKTQLVKK